MSSTTLVSVVAVAALISLSTASPFVPRQRVPQQQLPQMQQEPDQQSAPNMAGFPQTNSGQISPFGQSLFPGQAGSPFANTLIGGQQIAPEFSGPINNQGGQLISSPGRFPAYGQPAYGQPAYDHFPKYGHPYVANSQPYGPEINLNNLNGVSVGTATSVFSAQSTEVVPGGDGQPTEPTGNGGDGQPTEPTGNGDDGQPTEPTGNGGAPSATEPTEAVPTSGTDIAATPTAMV